MPLKDLFAIKFLWFSYFALYYLIFKIVIYIWGAFQYQINRFLSTKNHNKFLFKKIHLNILISFDQVPQIKIIFA